ncbi:MAG: hypothetical protein U0790_28525 [Isosphaeraceae bacterium]
MRNTRWIASLGRGARRVALAGGLCCCGWGCHHHHYYYSGVPASAAAPGCPPGTTVLPSTVSANGTVCEVPGDGPVITSNSGRSTVVSDGNKSRVVVSEPSGNSRSLFGWRPSDPEDSPAVTHVDGAISDSSVRK